MDKLLKYQIRELSYYDLFTAVKNPYTASRYLMAYALASICLDIPEEQMVELVDMLMAALLESGTAYVSTEDAIERLITAVDKKGITVDMFKSLDRDEILQFVVDNDYSVFDKVKDHDH